LSDQEWTKEELLHELHLLQERLRRQDRELAELGNLHARLEESEARLKETQQLACIGYWVWKPPTQEVFWSKENYRIFGLPPETVPSLDTFFSVIHPDELDFVKKSIDDALHARKPYNLDIRIIKPDGSQRTVNARGNVEYDGSGTPTRMFGTVRDITEYQIAGEALKRSEEKYRDLFENANDAIFIVDADQRYVDVNNKAAALVGYSRQELLTMSVYDFIPEEQKSRSRAEFNKLRQQGAYEKFRGKMRSKHGGWLDIEVSSSAIRSGGQYIGSRDIVRDITDQVRAEEALRKSESFVRTILDTVDEGFIVIDRDYRIVTVNRAFCRQAGVTPDQAAGRRCHEILHNSCRACHEEGEDCAVRRAFETGAPAAAVHQHRGPEGVMLYVETKAFPIRDETGAVTSVIETLNNITERHLLQEERLKTQKLEAVGLLAGGIAHDFNNLLQAIFGYISMARITFDERGKCLSMLEQAEKALHLAVNLTTQLLTFSKGGQPVKKTISLPPLIESGVKFALSGSRVNYRIEVEENLRNVEVDEGQIGQVIQNIVLNADQAMPLGGTIIIAAKNVKMPQTGRTGPLPEGQYVQIAIQDSGIGIPAQYLPKIFDPYFSTKEKGSGLGLATSYSIIRSHGGVIEVSSQAGKGSTFIIYLPAVDGAPEIRTVETPTPSARSARILVMDDQEMVRNIASEMITAVGHEAALANNGESAVEQYAAARSAGRPFDIVILDLTVPGGMGGKEALEKIRAIDPAVKAIVSSGYSDDAIVADFRKYGFSASLGKPYQVQELMKTLHLLLGDGG
jgi:two-component system cell cycle sensor histidine kinase/response regulator CckA